MADLILYSARICPFCHRSRLVLLEKGVDFDLVEIDLKNKPDWYPGLSPFGTVPALRHGEVRLWESTVINEYLEEVFPTPALLPDDPGERAMARIWIDFANSRFVPAFYHLLKEQDEERKPERHAQLEEVLGIMEGEGLGKLAGSGPYWLGSEVSLVDVAFYPWFERWPVLEHYHGAVLPENLSRLLRWRQAMARRPAVREGLEAEAFYIEGYRNYAAGLR